MQHIPTYIQAAHGEVEAKYPHPDLGEILDETYGVIVYQDQVLLIAQKFAGYSLGEADIMRKAMGKKIRSIMKGEEKKFLAGAMAKGYSEADARAIFELIEPFAGYAFNKAHSVSYGTIAYQTAYLKANYAEEYMTAVMMMAGTQERIAEAYSECVRIGIPVLQPDINRSDANFDLREFEGRTVIRYGLARVKNVGEGIAEAIIEEREANGPFTSLDNFFERVNAKHLNKRALECLVKTGAFDSLAERSALLAGLERLCTYAQNVQKQKEAGQASLFDMMAPEDKPALQGPQLEKVPEATKQQKLSWEKELLGIYLSEHPFAQAAEKLGTLLTCSLIELNAEFAGRDTIVGGRVNGIRSLNTKDGRTFIAAEIEDLTGSVEVTVWPETYEATRDLWKEGTIVVASVRIRENNDRLQVAVQRAAAFDENFDPQALLAAEPPAGNGPFRRNGGRPNVNGRNGNGNGAAKAKPPEPQLRIVLDETDDPDGDEERLRTLMEAIREYTGQDPVRLQIRQTDGAEVEMELPSARHCPELTRRLSDILGPWGNVYA
jgi:DNA polymerase-3 subunit alpha